MIAILGVLLKLLSSAGVGTIFGGIMGYFNRKIDLKHKEAEMIHELKLREVDAKIMREELEGKIRVVETEGAYDALQASYNFANPSADSKMGKFSASVRPFISLSYFLVSSAGVAWVIWYAFTVANVRFTTEQWFELVNFVIDWVAFMASTCIGWYYAVRAGTAPKR